MVVREGYVHWGPWIQNYNNLIWKFKFWAAWFHDFQWLCIIKLFWWAKAHLVHVVGTKNKQPAAFNWWMSTRLAWNWWRVVEKKGATAKSFAYVQLNKRVCFIFNISELCSYFAEDKFLEVYEILIWNSKMSLDFILKIGAKNVLLTLPKMLPYLYDRTNFIVI